MLKLVSLTLTSSYQNVDTLIKARTGRPFGDDRVLRNGLFSNTGAEVITLALGDDNDDVSNTIPIDGAIPFDEVNLSKVYAKAASSASTLEISGEV